MNVNDLIAQMQTELQAVNDRLRALRAEQDSLETNKAKLQADISDLSGYVTATGGVLP